jgi:succinate dehydrogenase/fumarate reductase cytochrome b subunit
MTVRHRLSALAGGVLLVYLWVWMTQLVVLDTSRSTFLRVQIWSASLPGRLVACVVLLAAVHHLLQGARVALSGAVDQAAGGGRDDQPLDGAADRVTAGLIFATWALVIPGWAVLLRPWIVEAIW